MMINKLCTAREDIFQGQWVPRRGTGAKSDSLKVGMPHLDSFEVAALFQNSELNSKMMTQS
jgi:hypothetical protein